MARSTITCTHCGSLVELPKLMGRAEVCEALGIQSGNLDSVGELPKPVLEDDVRATRLWLASDIKAFAKEYKARRRAREARARKARDLRQGVTTKVAA